MADPLSGLDNLAEVSDIVQRKKGLSTRMRNEAIRQGVQDPTNFQTEFAPQIAQAQQPTEFLGAGRKELADQNYDLSLPNLFGAQTQTSGGTNFYYGDYDPSKVQYGLGSYGKQDIGGGKYNILGDTGNVLGIGYYDPATAARQIFSGNAQKAVEALTPTKIWQGVSQLPQSFYQPLDDRFGFYNNQYSTELLPQYQDAAALEAAGYKANPNYNPEYSNNLLSPNEVDYTNPYLQQVEGYQFGGKDYVNKQDAINAIMSGASYGGARMAGGLEDWEVLGQALAGALSPAPNQQWGGMPVNSASETISGLNTLFGSTPVFYDGKLIGYKSNFGAAPGWEGTASGSGGQDQVKWNPFGYQATHSGKSHAWSTGLGRQIDPNAYQGLVQNLGNFDYFAPLSNVEKLPGWTNVEGYQHQDKNFGGWGSGLTSLGKALGPLDDIMGDFSLQKTGENLDKGGLLYTMNKHLARIDPAGEAIAKGVADLFGVKDGSLGLVRTVGEPVGNMLGAIFAYGLPIGSLAMSADSASQGNEKGATDALGRAAAAYVMSQAVPAVADSGMGGAPVEVGTTTEGVAANSMSGSSGGVFDSGISLGSTAANQAAQSYVINAAANYLQNGGNLEEALKAAAFSSASGQAGSWLANATQGQLGDIASKALGGAASGGLNSLFSKGSPVAGSLYGGMSGGLHGYLNTIGRGTEGGLTPEKNQQNRELARNATTLAKLFVKR